MTTYYICSGHKDGLGGNFRHIIKSNIYAEVNNYEFINFFNHLITNSQPFYKTFSILSNLKKIRDIPEKSKVIIYGDYLRKDIINYVKEEYKDKNFIIEEIETEDVYRGINRLKYNQNLREKHQRIFHNRNNDNLNLCSPNHINIVLHIRRGDVLRKIQDGTRKDYKNRFTSDNYYIKIIKKTVALLPKNKYKIILFSEGFEEEFKEYKERWNDIELHIDKEEWRYIINDCKFKHKDYNKAVENLNKLIVTCANADIFIGSKSHLSHILAYLNRNFSFFENYFKEDLSVLKRMYLFEDFEKVIPEIKDYVGKKM